MKASDLFVECLKREGVERIFGVPGEENADIMISLIDSGIEFILCRHEQAAAFMADVHGRLTGKAGVCLATLGPGATNLVTGLAAANLARAPAVALSPTGPWAKIATDEPRRASPRSIAPKPVDIMSEARIACSSLTESGTFVVFWSAKGTV